MKPSASAHQFAQTMAAVGDAIERGRDAGERAAGIAAALRSLWPGASLTACLLREGEGWRVAALDPSGKPRPDWVDALRDAAGGAKTPRLPGPVALAQMRWRGRDFGYLAVGIDDGRPMLDAFAAAAAAHFAADEFFTDLNYDAPRADVGELVGPLIHDVTNLLNNLLLNLAVLEQGGDLSSINLPRLRSRVEQVTGLIKEVQDYRRRKAPPSPPADINAAAREAVALLQREFGDSIGAEVPVTLDLPADLPPVPAARPDLVRCVLFLLKNAARAAREAKKEVRVSTAPGTDAVLVRVAVPGLQVLVESQSRLYDTLGAVCPGVSSLELATAKSIARRFNGRLAADCPVLRGLVMQLEVPIRTG
jgi:signal transduction histidine kinase